MQGLICSGWLIEACLLFNATGTTSSDDLEENPATPYGLIPLEDDIEEVIPTLYIL